MKNLRSQFGLLISITCLATPAMATEPAALVTEVKVDGLSCPFCAYGLEKKLIALPFVESVKIHVDAGRAVLVVKPWATPDVDAVEAAVRDGGFTPRGVTIRAEGALAKDGGEVVIVIDNGPRIPLEPNPKRSELMKAMGTTTKRVVVEGAARTDGTRTFLAVATYKVLG